MILASFICKMIFDDRLNHDNYYDNCIFKSVKVGQVPEFNTCDVTTKIRMMYEHIVEYADLLLFTESNRLFTTSLVRNLRTITKLSIKCKTTLNNFA